MGKNLVEPDRLQMT